MRNERMLRNMNCTNQLRKSSINKINIGEYDEQKMAVMKRKLRRTRIPRIHSTTTTQKKRTHSMRLICYEISVELGSLVAFWQQRRKFIRRFNVVRPASIDNLSLTTTDAIRSLRCLSTNSKCLANTIETTYEIIAHHSRVEFVPLICLLIAEQMVYLGDSLIFRFSLNQ